MSSARSGWSQHEAMAISASCGQPVIAPSHAAVLDYRESIAWARAARPIVAELDAVAAASPSRELVELLQRAVAHVVKVMMRAEDSSGLIGDRPRQLLDIHAAACDTAVADPVKLAASMI